MGVGVMECGIVVRDEDLNVVFICVGCGYDVGGGVVRV